MHTCVVISTPGAKFSALAVKDNFATSLNKVAQLGYNAVELAIRDPKLIDVTELKKLLGEYHLVVPAIGTGQAYGEEGLSLTDPDPDIRLQAIHRIKDQMNLAEELGGAQVIIGLIRGTVKPGMDRRQAEDDFFHNMIICLSYKPQINLVIEPINRYETNLYNNTASTAAFIEEINYSNLKMLVDTFHMNIEEPDINQSIYNVRKHISHVHFADTNRWAPGSGHLDFKSIIKTLEKIGYTKAVSAEILPEPSPDECLVRTMEFYKRMGIGSQPSAKIH